MVRAADAGWVNLIVYNMRGQRFCGCGFGRRAASMKIDVYGSSGDYIASGFTEGKIYIHGSAQDQVAQILRGGKLVIYGDVGQAFMYGAKGGHCYVMGNAAGRPLINATGKPRVVINGTCLDYLAESFMAGDPHSGGGFVVVNGIGFDNEANVVDLEEPYPGGNLLSLASGGAVYIRDPFNKLEGNQLNGAKFERLEGSDWSLIRPFLDENERLFGISVERLLTINGEKMAPHEVYKKVVPAGAEELK